MSGEEWTGLLIVNKPSGITSHDVVARVRRLTGQRRVGHAGTLDPLATGVLVLCLGQATRLAEYLSTDDKLYRARLRLGVTTDSFDAEGEVVSRTPVHGITRGDVERHLQGLIGEIQQVPPMYSALKHRGTPLHRLARAGVTVRRAARQVRIHRLELQEWSPPDLVLDIHCSKGTYVRVLAHDLGQRLGCGAHVTGLQRLASGRFDISQAVTLDDVARAIDAGIGFELLRPMDLALQHLPSVKVDEALAVAIGYGQQVVLERGPDSPECRAYAGDGRLLAILHHLEGNVWQPHKVFSGATKGS